ncbi:MAG: hypothetical protein HQK50_14065 [Oligoflexia bacterium]|nr:hypothetical protein [Oligoflexia bacterium]
MLLPAVNHAKGAVYCGNESSGFKNVTTNFKSSILTETMQFKNWVLTSNAKINLATFEVEERIGSGDNQALPFTSFNKVLTMDGGMVAVGYFGSIVKISSNGDSREIAKRFLVADREVRYQKILGLGKYAWTYATEKWADKTNGYSLRRIDLADGKLDAKEFIGEIGMKRISNISYSPTRKIRVDGINESEQVVIKFIDTEGGVSSEDNQTVSLDQIIDL